VQGKRAVGEARDRIRQDGCKVWGKRRAMHEVGTEYGEKSAQCLCTERSRYNCVKVDVPLVCDIDFQLLRGDTKYGNRIAR
jgi:hypothetical protein